MKLWGFDKRPGWSHHPNWVVPAMDKYYTLYSNYGNKDIRAKYDGLTHWGGYCECPDGHRVGQECGPISRLKWSEETEYTCDGLCRMAARSKYYEKEWQTSECPDGHAITSKDECEAALQSLGFLTEKDSNHIGLYYGGSPQRDIDRLGYDQGSGRREVEGCSRAYGAGQNKWYYGDFSEFYNPTLYTGWQKRYRWRPGSVNAWCQSPGLTGIDQIRPNSTNTEKVDIPVKYQIDNRRRGGIVATHEFVGAGVTGEPWGTGCRYVAICRKKMDPVVAAQAEVGPPQDAGPTWPDDCTGPQCKGLGAVGWNLVLQYGNESYIPQPGAWGIVGKGNDFAKLSDVDINNIEDEDEVYDYFLLTSDRVDQDWPYEKYTSHATPDTGRLFVRTPQKSFQDAARNMGWGRAASVCWPQNAAYIHECTEWRPVRCKQHSSSDTGPFSASGYCVNGYNSERGQMVDCRAWSMDYAPGIRCLSNSLLTDFSRNRRCFEAPTGPECTTRRYGNKYGQPMPVLASGMRMNVKIYKLR